nr:reverse transcriptase domain-containing protein [Tanacetum cinerariifolium]
MPTKRKSTSAALAMTQAAIRQLISDGIVAALEALAATMANTDNPNRNLGSRETPVAKKETTKSSYAVNLSTSTVRKELLDSSTGLNVLNQYFRVATQPIGIEQANKIAWIELKRILTNKYYPRTEIKKMEDEFYNLVVKENDLKTYIRRFQELALLCQNMVPNSEKLMEVFIGGLPKSIEENVTASKPQTLEEVITITQRLMDQVKEYRKRKKSDQNQTKMGSVAKPEKVRSSYSG